MTKTQKNYQIPSINKAIDVIILLSEQKELTFKEIRTELNLPISTCFNILNTLENRGFIVKNQLTSQYSIGLTLMSLGLQKYDSLNIGKIALPFISDLANKFGETSYLSIIDYALFDGLVLERVGGTKTLVVLRQVGNRFPLYSSGTGKSLLSGLSSDELNHFFETVKLEKFTENTITDEAVLRRELDKIRKNGYAISNQELDDGAASVSAPIKNYQHKVIAAISIAGPSRRIMDQVDEIIPEVKTTAENISKLIQ